MSLPTAVVPDGRTTVKPMPPESDAPEPNWKIGGKKPESTTKILFGLSLKVTPNNVKEANPGDTLFGGAMPSKSIFWRVDAAATKAARLVNNVMLAARAGTDKTRLPTKVKRARSTAREDISSPLCW